LAQNKQTIEIASIVFYPAIPGATIATAHIERHRIDSCISLMAGELALNRLEFALTFNDEVVFSRVTQWQAYCVPRRYKVPDRCGDGQVALCLAVHDDTLDNPTSYSQLPLAAWIPAHIDCKVLLG
jgi:hypothetical protein